MAPAYAATTQVQGSASGLAISPAIQQFVLSPKQTNFGFTVQVYNHTDQAVTLTLSTADFTTLNETGGVAFLGSNVSSVQKQHELGSFLQLGTKTIALAANASVQVPVTVTNANKLALGGHYAAILAKTSPANSAANGNRVTLNQVVSSLVFVETAGQGTKTLSLLKPDIDKLAFSLPSSVDLYFKATGNTQTVPRGLVTIEKGESPARLQGPINVDSSLLLPASTRLLTTQLSGNTHPLWPGVYHLTVQYRYDGSLGISTYETAFFYVNILFLLIFLVIVILAMLVLYKLRRFVRRVLRYIGRRSQSFKPATSLVEATDVPSEGAMPEPSLETEEVIMDEVIEAEDYPAELQPAAISAPADDEELTASDQEEPSTEPVPAEVPAKRTIAVKIAESELEIPTPTIVPKPIKKRAAPKKAAPKPKSKTKSKSKKSTAKKPPKAPKTS